MLVTSQLPIQNSKFAVISFQCALAPPTLKKVPPPVIPCHLTHTIQPKNLIQGFEHFRSDFIAACCLPSLQLSKTLFWSLMDLAVRAFCRQDAEIFCWLASNWNRGYVRNFPKFHLGFFTAKAADFRRADFFLKTCLAGAQPALHFGWGAIFMKFYSMTSSCLFNRGTNFSQTVIDKVLFATFPKIRTFQF